MILAMNLNSSMKRLALGESWIPMRMKAIRFSFINIPGRIIERSRELIIRLVKNRQTYALFLEARSRIMELVSAPSGNCRRRGTNAPWRWIFEGNFHAQGEACPFLALRSFRRG